jgi:hypothetical protein
MFEDTQPYFQGIVRCSRSKPGPGGLVFKLLFGPLRSLAKSPLSKNASDADCKMHDLRRSVTGFAPHVSARILHSFAC